MAIPEELVQQFRTVALERLERVEAAWATVLSSFDEEAAAQLLHELHTLKGESKMLGFSDVNLVCHKLEDMIEVARARGYAVDEDFDLAINMAVRFMAMLVRKKVGAQLGGIDLPGFIRQIDAQLAELRPEPQRTRASGGFLHAIKPAPSGPRVPTALRSRLAPIAIDVFIEYASARGSRRDRLRTAWHGLRDLVGIYRAVVGQAQLAKHKTGAITLARELGKRVEVTLDIGNVEATVEILATIDSAMLHLVRNAIDHGLETPRERADAGKPETGQLTVRCRTDASHFTMIVEDDGRGVSLDEVRARALDIGLITPDDFAIVETRWFDLICQPGFTTRAEASDVSGRGVGLDAVRSAVHEVGGQMTAHSEHHRGTRWEIQIPLPRITIGGHVMRVPGVPFPIVIDGSWTPLGETTGNAAIVDIAQRLGLTDDRTATGTQFFQRGDQTVGVVATRAPEATSVRRLVAAAAPAVGEVVLVDNTEGLLVHLDRALR